jgi:hypothetical protein
MITFRTGLPPPVIGNADCGYVKSQWQPDSTEHGEKFETN